MARDGRDPEAGDLPGRQPRIPSLKGEANHEEPIGTLAVLSQLVALATAHRGTAGSAGAGQRPNRGTRNESSGPREHTAHRHGGGQHRAAHCDGTNAALTRPQVPVHGPRSDERPPKLAGFTWRQLFEQHVPAFIVNRVAPTRPSLVSFLSTRLNAQQPQSALPVSQFSAGQRCSGVRPFRKKHRCHLAGPRTVPRRSDWSSEVTVAGQLADRERQGGGQTINTAASRSSRSGGLHQASEVAPHDCCFARIVACEVLPAKKSWEG